MAEKTLSIRLGLNDKQFQSALRGVRKSIKKLPGQMKQVGSSMTRSLTLPLAALGAGAVKLASDFEETNAKFNTVFSSMQGKANETAKNFQQNFGLSSRAAKQLLGDTGDLLVGFGFQEEAALNLSDQVNKLAVDLASFTNFEGGAEGASKALTKALVGETEAAKGLGIVIRQNTTEYKERVAAIQKEQGVSVLQAKALANLQIATEQSSKAIGDFSRTSGSFANQSRILKGNIEDLGVELGTALLPIAMKAINGFQKLVGAIKSASPETKRIAITIGILVAALGPALSLIGSISAAFALLTSPIGLAIAAITGIVAAFIFVRENYDAFAERLGDWSWWKNAILDAIKFLIEFNPLNLVIDGFNGILEFFGKNTIPNPFEDMIEGIDDLKDDTKTYENQFGSFTDAIKNQAKEAADALGMMGTAMGVGTGGAGGGTSTAGGGGPARMEAIQAGPISTNLGSGFENADTTIRTASEETERYGQKFTETMGIVQSIGNQVFGALSNLSASFFAQQMLEIEQLQAREVESANSQLDRELAALESDHEFTKIKEDRRRQMLANMTAEERKAFKAEEDFNNKRAKLEQDNELKIAAINEKAADEKKKIMVKEAKIQKVADLFAVASSTAASIGAAVAASPLTGGMPFAAINAGIGAAQMAAILAAPLPQLAEGGLAFGPTQAIVGDNFGAGVNPEVIAPLDKLKGMLGMETLNVVGTISGEDIVLASDRYNTRANRSF